MPKRNRQESPFSISMASPLPFTPPQLCPEAVRVSSTAGATKRIDSQKAKGHLLATGWTLFLGRKSNGRSELRYRSPAGKIYYSLRTACRSVPPETLDSKTTSCAVIKTKDYQTTSLPPLFCMETETCSSSRNKRRKSTKMRSMEDIMKDDRSLVSGVDWVLGGPSPVTGRGDLSWTLLKSELKQSMIHCHKLNQALEVMHQSFEPCEDPVTHKDVAEDIIFNQERDFFTVVLEKGDKVVTAANVRIHEGGVVAELPLAATGFEFRRQGMLKVLMNEIENWLRNIGIERLVLPSAQSALKTWTSSSIGFSTMREDEKEHLFSAYDCLDFQDTTMCQKQLSKNNEKWESMCQKQLLKNGETCGYESSSSDGSTISHEDITRKILLSNISIPAM